MRTIIAGSRNIVDMSELEAALCSCGWLPSVVLCGMAKGPDTLGRQWARSHKIPVEEYHAQWHLANGSLDRGAGIKRNCLMGDHADALLALWDGTSHGTQHMISYAKQKGLHVFVRIVQPQAFSIFDFC